MKVFMNGGLACALLFLLGACSTPEIIETVAPEFAAENLHPVRNTGFENAYVLPGAELPAYASVSFLPLASADVDIPQTTVSGTLRRDWTMTAEKEQKLAAVWSEA
ncbi:MAG: hypothetical protein V2I41_12595, partial [Pseudomonadales bacterium]|nr:hypothetical protein [Pseudomonadales bacterium]